MAKKTTAEDKTLLSERADKRKQATKEECIQDLRSLQLEHPDRYLSRNFYRVHGSISDSAWDCHYGTFKEFRRQAGLELTRQQHKLELDVARHSSVDYLRKFHEAEVLPYSSKYDSPLSTKRYKTVLVGSDFHDIDCDEFVLSVFIDTARRLQPDVIVLNGDVFDCYDSSKYDKDIRELKIVERFEFVKEKIFSPLREACPNSQMDLILGNHEWRIVNLLAAKTPNIRVILSDVMGLTLADVFGLEKYRINLVSKVDLAAFTEADRKKELRKNFRVYYDCFVVGHFKDLSTGMSGSSGHCHRPHTQTYTNLVRGKLSWVETGCMCHTEAGYVQHRDKWGQSFLIAHIDTEEKRVNPEHIIFAGDFIVVHGVRYTRK